MKRIFRKSGFGAVEALSILAVVALLGLGSWMAYSKLATKPALPASSTKTSTTSTQVVDPYAEWKTYTSSVEKVSFRYPANWTVDTKDALLPNDPTNVDYIALKSPDGKVVVHWTSEVDGFGDEHTDSYPYNKVVDITAMQGAPNHYVISGVTTLDGKVYYPWMAAEDNTQVTKFSSGVAGNVAFFMGINNLNPTTHTNGGVLFSTSGFRTNQGEPSLTESDAKAYLSSADMQQAKLILLSLHY